MREIKIGNKNYKLEYTIEAALYKDCAETVINFMSNVANAENKNEIKEVLSATIDVPNTCMTCFYAGLLENHGEEITSLSDAKQLIKAWFKENQDNEKGNFYGLFMDLLEIMGEDGFFKQLGLTQLVNEAEEATENAKIPQDHKKKQTKVSKK